MTQRRRFLLRLAARGPGPRASGDAARGSNPADSTGRETPRVRHTSALRGLLGAATFALAAATGAGFVALAAAPAAHAAPFVDVTYDIGDSTAVATVISIGVTTETPPHGTISGTQKVRYSSDSASGLATGPIDLLTFNLYVHATVGTYTYTAGGGRTFTTINTADLHFEFLSLTTGAATGKRLAGGTVTPYGASGRFRVTGTIHCYLVCGALGAPASTPTAIAPAEFTAPLPRLTGAVGSSHTVKGTASGVDFHLQIPGNVGIPITGTTFIIGREIQRTPVPEPSSLPLVAGGLVGLGLAAVAWRRRARV